jgi:hypothetical protein
MSPDHKTMLDIIVDKYLNMYVHTFLHNEK